MATVEPVVCPCALRFRPAPAPMEMPFFPLLEELKTPLLPPRVPRLRPAASPVNLGMLPHLELPCLLPTSDALAAAPLGFFEPPETPPPLLMAGVASSSGDAEYSFMHGLDRMHVFSLEQEAEQSGIGCDKDYASFCKDPLLVGPPEWSRSLSACSTRASTPRRQVS